MRPPSSRFDRPGYWLEAILILQYSPAALSELLRKRLLKRGGTPSQVPASVASAFRGHMVRHEAILDRQRRLSQPLYPSPQRYLSVTPAGWRYLEAGRRQVRVPADVAQSAADAPA